MGNKMHGSEFYFALSIRKGAGGGEELMVEGLVMNVVLWRGGAAWSAHGWLEHMLAMA